jgi:hypothetical protein
MKMLTIAATLAAFLVSTGASMAVPISGTPATPMPGNHPGQYQSNQNIRDARRHIARATGRLQGDAWDYGGHKEAAIDDLQAADTLLTQALSWIHSHNGRPGGGPTAMPMNQGGVLNNGGAMTNTGTTASGTAMGTTNNPGGNGAQEGQHGSNENITFVRQHIADAISALNSDDSDYGGFKHQAIGKLQAADSEMAAAVNFVHNPNVVNGTNKNQYLSNANLSYVLEHVNTAADRLGSDAHDYGGHRVDAINDLHAASSDLTAGLSYDKSHGNYNASAGGHAGPMGTQTMGQGQSNDSLTDASNQLETAIDALTRDKHDYGGYRVKAMSEMQAARTQIQAALSYRTAHPG